MGRFETELLATDANIEVLAGMNGAWIDKVHDRRPPKMIILDMDSISPTLANKRERRTMVTSAAPATIPYSCSTSSAIWSGVPFNVHSGRLAGLEPVVERYRERNLRRYFQVTPPLPHHESWQVRVALRDPVPLPTC